MDYAEEYIKKNPSLHIEQGDLKTKQVFSVFKKGEAFSGILDVGCGAGAVTLALAERFNKAAVEGIDISEKMINAARTLDRRNAVHWSVADVFRLDSSNKHFDLVVSTDLMEHLERDEDFLRILKKIGGTIIVRVPLEASLLSRLLVKSGLFDVWKDTEQRYGHVHHYAAGDMKRLFKKCGLRIVWHKSYPMPRRTSFAMELLRLIFYPLYFISRDLSVSVAGGFRVYRLQSIIN